MHRRLVGLRRWHPDQDGGRRPRPPSADEHPRCMWPMPSRKKGALASDLLVAKLLCGL